MSYFFDKDPFVTELSDAGIAVLEATDDNAETSIGFVNQALRYVEQIEILLAKNAVKAVVYYPLFPKNRMRFKRLFKEEQKDANYEEKLYTLLVKVEELRKQPKPVIAYVNYFTSGIDLAVNLWAHYTIVSKDTHLFFPEFQYGLLPSLGAVRNTLSRMAFQKAYAFLTESNFLTGAEAVDTGLFTTLIGKNESLLNVAEKLVKQHNPFEKTVSFNQEDLDFFQAIADKTRKETRGLIPATNAFLDLVAATVQPDGRDLLQLEAQLFAAVIADKRTEAMVRTGYYFMVDIRRIGLVPSFNPTRIGIVGAGMMGAGISFEAAKARKVVYLKDATLEQAVLGKEHIAAICEKAIQHGKLDAAEAKRILGRIHPVARYRDFDELDVIIEAVFENMELKKTVISASCSSLNEVAIYASNTTSLLISELATASDRPADFVGMHFFSPVERMNVVEIVRGKDTKSDTIERAMQLANQLGKTVIVVNDSPAFFTSRVFFNYLLEAITLLLEGFPAKAIEEEAQKAGFMVGPLTVLDEISLPLMLHVYDQLPHLNSSQKRVYCYLKSLIGARRLGRKAKKGFYDYSTDKKIIWQDPTIPVVEVLESDRDSISRRLLHVMALDSYRCLEEAVLEDPSDGDIGATLGIGFPHHTGGVFAHIDQVGLAQFVKDCEQYADKGDQWIVPDSLRKLASENFTFYTNFKSNWK